MEKREALTIGKSPISKEEKRIGKQFPEIDGYKVIKKEDRNLFNRVLQNKFEIIDEFNQSKK